jgi:hypothetical protein
VKGSLWALVTDETAGAVNEYCAARDRRIARAKRERRDDHRRDPQQQADNEKAGEIQR